MKFTNIFMALAMVSSLVLAGAIPNGSSVAKRNDDLPHPLTDLVFSGTVGGHEVTLTGDIQSIISQVSALFPDFRAEYLLNNVTDSDDVAARAANNKDGIICKPVPGQNWDWAYRPRINEGISYLNGLKGGCNIGPTSCVRISCSYNAAIFLCNDNSYAISPSCTYLASYASDICNNCFLNIPFSGGYCCGQEFDSDHYNIIVRYDAC